MFSDTLVDLLEFVVDFFSSMTSMQVHKDKKSPFLMSGCKVADGVGTMLVI